MEKIYKGTFDCELCRGQQEFSVSGMDDSAGPSLKAEAADWAKHWHWCAVHKLCAKCGALVASGDLEMAVNDGRIKIHASYTDQYHSVREGDIGHLLIVHRGCL